MVPAFFHCDAIAVATHYLRHSYGAMMPSSLFVCHYLPSCDDVIFNYDVIADLPEAVIASTVTMPPFLTLTYFCYRYGVILFPLYICSYRPNRAVASLRKTSTADTDVQFGAAAGAGEPEQAEKLWKRLQSTWKLRLKVRSSREC